MLFSSVSMYTVHSCFAFISLSVYYVKCIVESYLAFCACIQRMVVQHLVVQACAPRVYCICCPPLPPLFKENGAEGGKGEGGTDAYGPSWGRGPKQSDIYILNITSLMLQQPNDEINIVHPING